MDRIEQESPHSCGIAAMQMVTLLPPKTIHSMLGYSPDDINVKNNLPYGTSEIEVIAVLWGLGYSPSLLVTKEHLYNISVDDASRERINVSLCLPNIEFLYDILIGNIAILCTKDHHMVVWDELHILDPDPAKPGHRDYFEYEISSAIIIIPPHFQSAQTH